MHTRSKPFWRLPWWEWLILIGSLGIILSFYLLAATSHARMLKRTQQRLEDQHRQHEPDIQAPRRPT